MNSRRFYSPIFTSYKMIRSINTNLLFPSFKPSVQRINFNMHAFGISNRFYSIKPEIEQLVVDFNHVKQATNNENILIIDVREPEEVKEHGQIPNSINIPLGSVTPTLSTMPDKEFSKIFKRHKPNENTEIIFYCMIGKRSAMAQQNALNLGFKNVKNYLGSWTDWANKIQVQS